MSIYESGAYLSSNPQWHSEDSPWKAAQIASMLRRNAVKFQSVVEVGCGAGQVLVELQKVYASRTFAGYDITDSVEKFWSKVPTSIHLLRKDFLSTQDTYDVLLLIDVFEHVRDYMGFLSALRQRAHYHVFHIPLELSAQGVLRDVPIKTRRLVGHLHYFSRTTALATLEDCGYRILDWAYANAALDRPASVKARMLNLIRRPMYTVAPELTVRTLGGWSLLVLAERAQT